MGKATYPAAPDSRPGRAATASRAVSAPWRRRTRATSWGVVIVNVPSSMALRSRRRASAASVKASRAGGWRTATHSSCASRPIALGTRVHDQSNGGTLGRHRPMTTDAGTESGGYTNLASYRHCVARISGSWPGFTAQRRERLRQGLFGAPMEKIAENILEDLFTQVLDWTLADVNLQVGRADIILSELGIKRLVLEVKRPGSLLWHRRAVEAALAQALGYAASQRVGAVAVSDGHMLYAADIVNGGLRDRLFVTLEATEPPLDLWWVSVHGIYRPCLHPTTVLPSAPVAPEPGDVQALADAEVLQPKYGLPSRCFAYVGAANQPGTWKLPYLLADGTPDQKRLPKAIQSILSNYRGAKVSIPREAVGDVLVRLGQVASSLGKMPCQYNPAASAYVEAHDALKQLDRLNDVGCCNGS